MILSQINTGTYKLQKVSDSQKSDMYCFVKKKFEYFYLTRFSNTTIFFDSIDNNFLVKFHKFFFIKSKLFSFLEI